MGQICGICIISDFSSRCVVLLTNTTVMSHSLGPEAPASSTQHHQHENPTNPEPHNKLSLQPQGVTAYISSPGAP